MISTTRCTRFVQRDTLRHLLQYRAINPSLNSVNPIRRSTPFRHASAQTIPSRSSSIPFAKTKSSAYYAGAVLVSFLGLTYAAVPIYRIVCQKTGWGGTPMTDSSKFTPEHMVPVPTANGRRIKVSFSASTSDTLPWSFRPQQREISVLPGETALAFYKAKNTSNEDIIGIATYNVLIPI
jgi:cytochrome c oxidase assembly protein Cox11